ncbi:uncharacterized protein B0I36DRAFT_239951 [Microdochium trichocladiopsis]|uniref:Calcineurin-like phosphoesterase domain-containing protein n=1 Tax=Microdochium trichocladiopsis TaxID=1682393 RepID=A0A9P8Y9Q3_9PEZI|nr:uncharacterized protein B0I36DRAFT_239951 [Microdochium trichocladiopsis]KAH7035629.1 hypothetical protein B0I36DRAFT_239951 [Microdochium trichocladiopsis]
MVRIQIISDLHLETPPKSYDIVEIAPRAPYLALLGDIGCCSTSHKAEYLGFLRRHLRVFRVVFLVLGNHEAYHSTWQESRDVLREFEAEVRRERRRAVAADVDGGGGGGADGSLGEFVLLDRDSYTIHPDPDSSSSSSSSKNLDHSTDDGAVTILGCTLFSHVPIRAAQRVSMGLNDFRVIGDGWDVAQHNAAFRGDLAWLNEQVMALSNSSNSKTKIVIFTHHCPTLDDRAIDPQHRGSPLTAGFASDLSKQPCVTTNTTATNKGIVKLWAFGHTHYNCDFVDDDDGGGGEAKSGIRFYTNQRGYYHRQSPGYQEDKVVEV